ncbi:DNA translocase FtsK [Bacilli bacterium]|uniref:DNA translocase FtsK n=1 Tax=Oceanobacillus caeni TaxID=405946 RepID=UPI000621FDB1|nr:stage III sporulation protein E [Bacilli bacterium VT-13-104]PZD83236.1 DNA translocase FtsK [Bacilli bacterium]PZD84362.1 DNA translocase FtsK [Bacilli bacterium]PZD86481.1 DNA translocase FtsK [Bacilli bacterium]RCO05030.1 DNA translocase FtsK [Bacilli bacterium]
MFEKWKNKIKEMFIESDEPIEKPHETKSRYNQEFQQDLKARVTYRYPKEKPFRFPVIPDEKTENTNVKNSEEEKTYFKQNRNERKNDTNKHYRTEQNSPFHTETNIHSNPPKSNNKKIYKKTDEPFKVSEVPSPIFGFQKRERKEEKTDDIPPYIQQETDQKEKKYEHESMSMEVYSEEETNQDENNVADNILDTSSLLEKKNDSQDNESKIINESLIELELQDTDNSTEIENTSSDGEEEYVDKRIEDVEKEKDNVQEPNVQENEYKEEVAVTVEEKAEDVDKQAESTDTSEASEVNPTKVKENEKSTVIPFNVIMTPSDKRNLHRRKMEELKSNFKEEKPKETSINNHSVQPNEKAKPVKTTPINHSNGEKEIFIPNHLLNDRVERSDSDDVWVEEQQRLLEETLKHFNVRAKVVKATQGPSVTRFEVHPELGVKVSKIKNLSDDLKLNMAARDIRIEAPIPGKNTVGIEIPNQKSQMVGLQEIFETEAFKDSKSPLTVALGLSIEGEPKITDIQKMPHGLIAGATGSGKSVCINTMLVSLLYKASHEDVKILLIDPKMVELAPYNGIPHLVTPVITDVKAATQSLKWAVTEMEDRYERFVHEGVRNIEAYNKKIRQQNRIDEKMPFIVIVIDELADLMMTSPQDVEDSISRIAQKARACGIHLILATQRPSVDVITGLIKANIPTRIAFSVSSQVDSRTIIDVSGAEKLLGRGDMLFVENGAGKSVRLQGPFVSDEEIERITNYARSIAEPNYLFEPEDLLEQVHMDEEEDELLHEVIDFVLSQNSASTSMIQRRFKIGYNRAARLMDTLEYKGIISGQNGSKPREVLIRQKQEDM